MLGAQLEMLRWLRRLASETGRRIPVRLVKGAYWDSEIKWAQERGLARGALAAGAAGFIPKSLRRSAIVDALKTVLAGDFYAPEMDEIEAAETLEDADIQRRIDSLTPQQKVVLRLVVAGKLNKQIAYELDVSMTTVKAHVSAILAKLKVFSRTQAVILVNKVKFGTDA